VSFRILASALVCIGKIHVTETMNLYPIMTLRIVTAPVSAPYSQTSIFVLDRKSGDLNSKQTRAGKLNHNVSGA
jgi:hypothetical protein